MSRHLIFGSKASDSKTFKTIYSGSSKSQTLNIQILRIVLLCIVVTMVSIYVIVASSLAWYTVTTLTIRVQHLTCLLSYHANHSINCNDVYPGSPLAIVFGLGYGSHFVHQSVPTVGPISQISSFDILLLPILEHSTVWYEVSFL
jgi:hypothetical protein